MINRLDIADADFAARLARLLHWSPEQDQGIETAVSGILADIRARGDEALLDYTRRFDRVPATQAADLRLTKADLQAALDSLPATERTALERAAERGTKGVLILGHTGKLVKIAAGIFHTHNRMADARLETLAAYAAAEGLSQTDVRAVLASNTTEDALAVIASAGLAERVCAVIAARVRIKPHPDSDRSNDICRCRTFRVGAHSDNRISRTQEDGEHRVDVLVL